MYEVGDFLIASLVTGPYPSQWTRLQTAIGIADIPVDPDWNYQPFAEVVQLGSGADFGRGFSVIEWHWEGLRNSQKEALRVYCPSPAISSQVYICSPVNETTSGERYWTYVKAQMNWPGGSQENIGILTRDFPLRFIVLEEITP